MAWAKYFGHAAAQDGGTFDYIQWTDFPLAAKWFQRAADLASEDAERQLDAGYQEDQLAAVRAAWSALSNGLRALNLPATSDPEYWTLCEKWFGRLGQTPDNAMNDRLGPAGIGAGLMQTRIAALWSKMIAAGIGGLPPLDAYHRMGWTFCRIYLGQDAAPVENYAGAQSTPAGGDFWRRVGAGCVVAWPDGSFNMDCTAQTKSRDPAAVNYSWNTLAWQVQPQSFLAASNVWIVVEPLSPPLRWFFEMAREYAATLVSRGPQMVLEQSRLWVVAQNAKTALDMGILAGDDALISAATDAKLQIGSATGRTQANFAAIAAVAAVIAAAATAVGGPYGAAAGAIISGLVALYGIAPLAVGYNTDQFGRRTPLWEQAWISAPPSQDGRPEFTVPEPPDRTDQMATLGIQFHRALPPPPTGSPAGSPGATPPPSGVNPNIIFSRPSPTLTAPKLTAANLAMPPGSLILTPDTTPPTNGGPPPPTNGGPPPPLDLTQAKTDTGAPAAPAAAPGMTPTQMWAWGAVAAVVVVGTGVVLYARRQQRTGTPQRNPGPDGFYRGGY